MRVRQLGFTLVDISHDGHSSVLGQDNGVELVVASQNFSDALCQSWEQITDPNRLMYEVLPGVILVSMPIKRRRRVEDRFNEHSLAVVVLTESIHENGLIECIARSQQITSANLREQLSKISVVSSGEVNRLVSMLSWMHQDVTEIDRRLTELQSMSLELSESYEELSLLYKLSVNMRVNQEPAAFLQDACVELQQVLGVKWLAIQLIEDDPRLEDLAGRLITAGDCAQSTRCVHEAGKYLMVRMSHEEHSVVHDDTAMLDVPLIPKLAKTMLIVPIRFEGKQLGILFGGDKIEGTHIDSIDVKLCDSLVNSMSIFLGNMMLYEDAQSMFIGTLHALTNAIDAKDSYTHGHSERVALMSRNLAEAAGFDATFVERTYIAGLLHDVGKIGVPESVLSKPGRLSESEYDQIKQHPEIGSRIVSGIRQMSDLIPGVLCHHERWDGCGYPNKLAGNDIPIMGRIIGLADAFDAMSSNRTYRQAMNLNEVLSEIVRCRGQQFDPELVDVFVRLDFSPFFDLIAKHHDDKQKRISA
ncbi:Cyclic di-GMP phosphodiesterase response regulator RpfG [Poriferisphaera corsica]|uniref:Cyclic di-GMP phosphodiesterase response regulator RpfG n=2 Tax=Poriferisphaera corsica TaxID=2528020 RepID=A0A517YYA2_9BACT|nr:Cyclic di-GMP phosphodiesterase response regulator RpfG [Poriferisphaera corsica]